MAIIRLYYTRRGAKIGMAVAGGSTASTWKETFKDGVVRIMDNWRGLQLAVEQQFGGPDSEEKHEWLMGVTGDFMLDNGNC